MFLFPCVTGVLVGETYIIWYVVIAPIPGVCACRHFQAQVEEVTPQVYASHVQGVRGDDGLDVATARTRCSYYSHIANKLFLFIHTVKKEKGKPVRGTNKRNKGTAVQNYYVSTKSD